MADQKLSVQLTIDATGMVQGLTVATKGVDTAAQAIKRSFSAAAEGTDGLTGALSTFKKETTQASRVANFYARDLAEIIPVAGEAKAAIRNLFTAGVAGGGIATGFEVALTVIGAITSAFREQAVEAQKLRDAHISVSAEIFKGLVDVQRGLDGDTTSVQKFKQSFKDATTDELIKANKEASALLQKSGGLVDFFRYMTDVLFTGKGEKQYTTGISEDIDKAFSAVIQRTRDFDAQRGQIAMKRAVENDKLNEKEAVDEILIRSQTSDAIVRMEAERDARVRNIRLQTWGAEQSVRERAQKLIAAVETDSAIRVSRLQQDKALETRTRIRALETENRTEQEQLQAAMLSRLEKLRLDLSRTTDARLRADIQAIADFEVKTTRAKIARLDALQAAEIAAADHNSSRGEYGKKTEEATKLVELYYQTETQHDALAEAHNDKRVADELISVREGAAKQLADITTLETAGLYTHEVFARRKKDIEKTLADETGAIWAKAGSHWANDFVRPLETGFASAVKSVVHGTATIGQAIESLGMSIVDSMIEGAIKVGLKTLEEAIIGHAATAAKNVAAVTSYAAVGGAAGASAVAGIPIIGPAIAIETGVALDAAIMSTFGPQAAAAQGFDIPAGINPITQLHQKEMVLPQNIADPLRDMLAGGGGDGGGQPIVINALDSQSFEEYMGRPATQQKIANLRRTGRWGG